jgi:transcriptional regulator with XRE-family HTH domain
MTKEADLNALIGRRIKELRILKNISQLELAEKCDFERSNLSRIEAGRTNLTLSSLNKIASAWSCYI